MDIKAIHHLFLKCSSISIDTRKIKPNSFFVAIKGDNFDANSFTNEAMQKGASYVVIDNADYYVDERTIIVPDSLTALQQLAAYHRIYLDLPIIALTGSNGKTTTKELIQVVLSKKYRTMATVGNLNNHIGVPLTLLSFSENTEIGVVEMGANHQKEIEFLCTLAKPNFGYITNFGKAHLEGFGGFEGVLKGKSELYDYLRQTGGTAFVNVDDILQRGRSEGISSYSFGVDETSADLKIDSITADPFVTISFRETEVKSQLIGLYNANNIIAAIIFGDYFQLSDAEIKEAIESYLPANNRSQLVDIGTNKIILDAYNANPSSMAVAIANFQQLDNQNRIAILGDMFELGSESLSEHKQIIGLLESHSDIQVLFVGADFYSNKTDHSHFIFFKTFNDLSNYLENQKIVDNTILIKGSRGMALEKILDFI